MKLSANRLCKHWSDGRLAVHDFSAEFYPGEITALIGRNGSGKTTILRMLAGLLEPNSGTVARPPGRIGFLFQQGALWPHLTVRQQLQLTMRLVATKDQPRGRAEQLMKEFNIESLGERYPAELSGGQQQRVAIARCLCVSPSVVFLDEVDNSLDPAARHEVTTLIERLRVRGLVVVASTHDLYWVKNSASKAIYIKEGAIIRNGTPEFVMNDDSDEMFSSTHSIRT